MNHEGFPAPHRLTFNLHESIEYLTARSSHDCLCSEVKSIHVF